MVQAPSSTSGGCEHLFHQQCNERRFTARASSRITVEEKSREIADICDAEYSVMSFHSFDLLQIPVSKLYIKASPNPIRTSVPVPMIRLAVSGQRMSGKGRLNVRVKPMEAPEHFRPSM